MLLTIVLIVQPAVATLPVKAKLLPDTATVNDKPLVSPKSVVVVSVKLTAVPDHNDIICPALASLPDFATYSNHAPSYDAVGSEYTVNTPAAATVFLTVVVTALVSGSPY